MIYQKLLIGLSVSASSNVFYLSSFLESFAPDFTITAEDDFKLKILIITMCDIIIIAKKCQGNKEQHSGMR